MCRCSRGSGASPKWRMPSSTALLVDVDRVQHDARKVADHVAGHVAGADADLAPCANTAARTPRPASSAACTGQTVRAADRGRSPTGKRGGCCRARRRGRRRRPCSTTARRPNCVCAFFDDAQAGVAEHAVHALGSPAGRRRCRTPTQARHQRAAAGACRDAAAGRGRHAAAGRGPGQRTLFGEPASCALQLCTGAVPADAISASSSPTCRPRAAACRRGCAACAGSAPRCRSCGACCAGCLRSRARTPGTA